MVSHLNFWALIYGKEEKWKTAATDWKTQANSSENIPVEDSETSTKEIGPRKIMSIMQRGLKKDFFDLYSICHTVSTLPQLLLQMDSIYPNIKIDKVAMLKALCYFGDAVEEVPMLVKDFDWESVKKYFRAEVRKLAQP